jgi:hypothetical protein
MEVINDLRYCLRRLNRAPAFTLTTVFLVALGIGAATAIYGFVDAALVEPLPYREPARLVALFEHNPVGDRFHLSDFDYRAWKQRNHVFTSIDVYRPERDTLSNLDGAEEVAAALVSDGFFRTLGVTPALGRDFFAGEDRPDAPRTAILSYAAWKQRFGGDPRVLGHTVKLNGESYTLVGVLPRDFHFAPVGRPEFWTTLHGRCEQLRDCFPFYGVARLRDGVSSAAAYEDVSAIARQIAAEYPQYSRDRSATLLPLTEAVFGKCAPDACCATQRSGASMPDRICERFEPVPGASRKSQARDCRARGLGRFACASSSAVRDRRIFRGCVRMFFGSRVRDGLNRDPCKANST